ncbi:hypothetical protein [Sorangium sp. So ce124]|uniref:hypothetical protein n=1 Tax=Sorangium sp. So ce124 TaxID=3133280 RepID=UPI003F5E7CB5
MLERHRYSFVLAALVGMASAASAASCGGDNCHEGEECEEGDGHDHREGDGHDH